VFDEKTLVFDAVIYHVWKPKYVTKFNDGLAISSWIIHESKHAVSLRLHEEILCWEVKQYTFFKMWKYWQEEHPFRLSSEASDEAKMLVQIIQHCAMLCNILQLHVITDNVNQ
jgi:hypothetical protein